MGSINDLLLSETTDIEFKESLEMSKPKSWLKTVSAFANGIGGSIYWGIGNDRNVIGISDAQQMIEKISAAIKAKIEPILLFKINLMDMEGKTIVQLEVKSGVSTPYYYVNEGSKTAYVRNGNESIVAPAHILNELIIKGQRLSYDAMASRHRFQDISFTLFEATYKQRTRVAVEKTSDYLSFGIVDESGILTNAGVLLSDQCPILPSRIFCTRWNGLDKGSIFEDAIDDKEYSGSEKSSEKSSEKILKMIALDNTVTMAEIAGRIGISRRAVEKQVAGLKAKGILQRVGADRGGHWKIVKHR